MYSVNARDFGFLPENSGEKNAAALQALADRGGTIVVDVPGVYEVAHTVVLKGDTSLIFGAGVYLKRGVGENGVQDQTYVFINRGAFTREWDYNISITGMRLITGGLEVRTGWKNGGRRVIGLEAHLAFFYIKNLVIRDFETLDLGTCAFCIQICTFENALLENIHIEGMKDGIHFGKGSKFAVRHGIFRTYDDPIALNANDYSTSNPQQGWIENGVIEDCYDLDQPETTGFFCRILAGAWREWEDGMVVRHSDSVLSEGRLYRVAMNADGATYVTHTRPTHPDGAQVLDGINWVMVQDDDPVENCGCRNIHFKDIFLEKRRQAAFAIHFDNDNYSRSYYPYAKAPVQKDLIFENIYMLTDIKILLFVKTPVNTLKVLNSVIDNTTVELKSLDTPGIENGVTHVLFSGCTFRGDGQRKLVHCRDKRSATLKITGSIQESDAEKWVVDGDVKLISSDIPVALEPLSEKM